MPPTSDNASKNKYVAAAQNLGIPCGIGDMMRTALFPLLNASITSEKEICMYTRTLCV